MQAGNFSETLANVVKELSDSKSYQGLFHRQSDDSPLPSSNTIHSLVEELRILLFPGYFGNSAVNSRTITYHIGVHTEKAYNLLKSQILAGLCFDNTDEDCGCTDCQQQEAAQLAVKFMASLPDLRRILATDGEVISCYPAIRAITNYRIAHQLLVLGVPLIPRIITEQAHSETGIDIHPGAQIGHSFAIDHGTGVVIGETCVIGNNVKLYQGVTLGARSFPLDADGKPIKGIPRHPKLEDDVIIYSNATILGRITIGKGATVGGNIWVTENVRPGARITQNRAKEIDNFKNYAI